MWAVYCLLFITVNCYDTFDDERMSFESLYSGYYSQDVDFFYGYYIPINVTEVSLQWKNEKSILQSLIGSISSPNTVEAKLEKLNDASSSSDLYTLASNSLETFKKLIDDVQKGVGSNISFTVCTPDPNCLLKTHESLDRKIKQSLDLDPTSKPWHSVDDALRETFYVYDHADVGAVVDSIVSVCVLNGFSLVIQNLYETNLYEPAGYVSVHAKIYMTNEDKKSIWVEIQIHFFDLMDGTDQCPKQYTHGIYEVTRSTSNTSILNTGNSAQKLTWLFGIHRYLERTGNLPLTISSSSIWLEATVSVQYYYANGLLIERYFDESLTPSYNIFDAKHNDYKPVSPVDFLEFQMLIEEDGTFLSVEHDETVKKFENKLHDRAKNSAARISFSSVSTVSICIATMLINENLLT